MFNKIRLLILIITIIITCSFFISIQFKTLNLDSSKEIKNATINYSNPYI